ncbi:hypothetical protein AAFF_G00159290 [Aldrovandia affinis]|uniref:Uncharacterized protein n=1 Tax=Aldrovandia affinis TaxID=143900 RepID=A0AAD7W8D2_9TELE|nr:hypothetical protein AAFF_G00159290 [Aldrovandia affinis]
MLLQAALKVTCPSVIPGTLPGSVEPSGVNVCSASSICRLTVTTERQMRRFSLAVGDVRGRAADVSITESERWMRRNELGGARGTSAQSKGEETQRCAQTDARRSAASTNGTPDLFVPAGLEGRTSL